MRQQLSVNHETRIFRILLMRSTLRVIGAVLLLMAACLPLTAEGTKRTADIKNLGGQGPGDMAVVKRGNTPYLEMINFDNKQIVTYRIEANNALTEVARTPTCDEPRQLSATNDNRWLFVACSSQDKVRVYQVLADPSQGSAAITRQSAASGPSLGPPTDITGVTEPYDVKTSPLYDDPEFGPGYLVTTTGRVTGIQIYHFKAEDGTVRQFDTKPAGGAPHDSVLFFTGDKDTGRIVPVSRSSVPSLSSGANTTEDVIAVTAVANSTSNDLTLFQVDRQGKLRVVTSSVPVGGSPRALAFDPSGRRLYVAVRSTPPGADVIRTYKVSPGGELTLVGTTPGGRFLTDIEATADRVYVVTVNNQNRDEIRTYRRRGNELVLDTALATSPPPGQPPSFKQITVAPGQGNLTNVFVTEYQAGFLRSVEYTRDNQVACAPDSENLCLNGVEVQVDFLASGNRGFGQAAPLTSDTGSFWFFNRENVELVPKVLDGRAINGSLWVFYGALSNVAYRLRLTDTRSGRVNEYENKAGNLASGAHTDAFPAASAGPGMEGEAAAGETSEAEIAEVKARTQEELYALLTAQMPAQAPLETAACAPGGTKLCLSQNRFEVRVDWRVPSQGRSGSGTAAPLTGDTGYFTFFDAANVELIIKVLDARVINGKFWVFYGALSNVEYTITVTDTETGQVKIYFNPSGNLASVADTSPF